MNEQAKVRQEIRELLIAAGAAEATEQQLARLNELMLKDAKLQEYAGQLLLQMGNIRWAAHQNVASSLAAIGSCLGEQETPGDASDSRRERVATGPKRNRFASIAHAARSSWRSLRRPNYRQSAWVIAATTAMIVAGWLWNRSGDHGPEVARFDIAKNPLESLPTLSVGKVHVDSGIVRLGLPSVGYVVVDGPAEFELVTPMRLRIDRGRIKVRVTEPTGHGFVVTTPHGEVTDLGTEFGVEVSDENASDLVVFEGEVDLRMPGAANSSVERLIGGEGVSFAKNGHMNRIMSISTGRTATYQRSSQARATSDVPLIVNVSDTLLAKDTKRFYEIVQAGLQEDSVAYVDRPYEWNGVDKAGMPEFLLGADYVKTFNDHKRQLFQLTVEVSQPVDLYLFWDERVVPTEWLESDFVNTGKVIAIDTGRFQDQPSRRKLGKGPGDLVDYRYSIWHKRVAAPGAVQLGSLHHWDEGDESISMYGIAAVAMRDQKKINRKASAENGT